MRASPFLMLTAAAIGSSLTVSAAMAGQAPAAAAGANAARGAKLFLQCAACHTVAPGAASTVGPNLSGVFGAKAATHADYSYSPALAKAGLVWDAANLDAFIKRPSQKVPGTKMAFGGVADPAARADLIAYLATLKAKK
jgi:cytochrome c